MASIGRKRNPSPSQSKRLAFSPETMAYLEEIATTGIYGTLWTDVAKKFIGDGIAQALRDKFIAIRKTSASEANDDGQKSEAKID